MVVPQNGWFTIENPNLKWMRTAATPMETFNSLLFGGVTTWFGQLYSPRKDENMSVMSRGGQSRTRLQAYGRLTRAGLSTSLIFREMIPKEWLIVAKYMN